MAIPAYLWLKDDGGADIRGSVDGWVSFLLTLGIQV